MNVRPRGLRRPSTALAALALAVVALSSPAAVAASAPAKAANGRPPVITEAFKPVLSCDPNTTVGEEGCGEHKVLRDDALLNAEVKVVFGLLTAQPGRRDFVTAESAWMTYRDADCESQSDAYQGGTEQPVAYVYCLAADDTSRSQDLKGFYDVLIQGAAHAPKFP